MAVVRAAQVRLELLERWTAGAGEVELSRGGEAYLLDVIGETGADSLENALTYYVETEQLYEVTTDDDVLGFASLSGEIITTLYVAPEYRRRGVARSLLEELFQLDEPPCDAWVLPGDRATKSLYENVGWKARLLTMGDE
jgi:GNAT superfamily N-acetyltransferase